MLREKKRNYLQRDFISLRPRAMLLIQDLMKKLNSDYESRNSTQISRYFVYFIYVILQANKSPSKIESSSSGKRSFTSAMQVLFLYFYY